MNPPPPRSTLFPYTTLFRSALHDDARRFGCDITCGESGAARRQNDVRGAGVDDREQRTHDRADVVWKDRKSTRLNSSHLVISYAVFCLKKKKTAIENQSMYI